MDIMVAPEGVILPGTYWELTIQAMRKEFNIPVIQPEFGAMRFEHIAQDAGITLPCTTLSVFMCWYAQKIKILFYGHCLKI